MVISSATYESMQVLLSEHSKKNVVSSFSSAVLHRAVDGVFVRCDMSMSQKKPFALYSLNMVSKNLILTEICLSNTFQHLV